METAWDKTRAVLFAIGVHAFALALLFAGLFWQVAPKAEDAAGPMIEATLVSSPQQSASIAKAIKAAERKVAKQDDRDATPPPQPKPSPQPQDAPQPVQQVPQAALPKPDTVNQEEVRRLADQAAAQQLKEQEARRKQAQIDLTNQKLQQQEEQNRQRLAAQELDRQKQLEAIRKQRAEAERQVKLEEQRLKQLQDQRAQLAKNDTPTPPAPRAAAAKPPAGNNGEDNGLMVKYKKAIRDVVQQNWHTANAPENTHCKVQVKQLPGGEVFDVTFLAGCPFDPTARASVVDALKRTPLPYAGFESVFSREFSMDMCYPEDVCTHE
jgi:colicin import membrane protein